VTAHFAEWGELSYGKGFFFFFLLFFRRNKKILKKIITVKVVWDKAIAFVRYRLRCTAEFAKEAMQDQCLDGDEVYFLINKIFTYFSKKVLSLRWSNEDPNPQAKEKEEEELYMELAKKVAAKQEKEDPMFRYKNADPNAPPLDTFPSQYYPNQYPDTVINLLILKINPFLFFFRPAIFRSKQ
jgi:hypothetical protein